MPSAPEAAPAAEAAPVAEPAKAEPEPSKPAGRVMASPRAKKRAKETGIDLSYVTGSGPKGRITEKDVLRAQETMVTGFTDQRKVRNAEIMSPLRRTIARRMTESWQHPHITMVAEIDMTEVVSLRNEINNQVQKKHGIRVSYNDIIVKAVADTLEKFPLFNATLAGNEIRYFDDINVGVAMATDDGLIVPIVSHANKKSITEIALETKALGKKAKDKTLTPEELTGSTFTVSNLGHG